MSSYPSETLENIERFIREYDGTAIGQSVKNMLDNIIIFFFITF